MLISKVKLEELRTKLHTTIYNVPFAPYIDQNTYGCDNNMWSVGQLRWLNTKFQNLDSNAKCAMTNIIDEMLDTLYTQEDMEKDLKLR